MGAGYVDKLWPGALPMAIRWGGSTPVVSAMTAPPQYRDAADADLMAWSARGDRRAFDEVVTRHGPFALRVAARLIANTAVAEDVVQEAMVRAWAQASRFDPARAKLTTWLYRIVVNLCIDHSRRAKFDPLPDDFDPMDPSDDAHTTLEAAERLKAVTKAIGELPIRHRAAMTLVYDEGLSGAEAARILGTSAKAVERLLSRALISLRARLLPEQDR